MFGSCNHALFRKIEFHVDRAREERTPGSEYQFTGIERVLDRTERRGFRNLAEFRGRGILSFGQTVDLVVEQQNIDVDVTAYGVDQVVAADGQ